MTRCVLEGDGILPPTGVCAKEVEDSEPSFPRREGRPGKRHDLALMQVEGSQRPPEGTSQALLPSDPRRASLGCSDTQPEFPEDFSGGNLKV